MFHSPLKIAAIQGLNDDHRSPDTFFNDGAAKRFAVVYIRDVFFV
jgi:hypothetical protein